MKQIKKRLIAIFIAPLLVSTLSVPSTAAADSVEVLLELVTPYAPVGSDTVLFQGTYRNKTNLNLTNLSLQLLLSDPIVNRSALNTALNSNLPAELTPRGQNYKVSDLKPGAIAPFSIGINAAQLMSKGPGAYLAGFQLISGTENLGSAFTALPYLPDRNFVTPLGITLLWPVTAPPLRDGDGILLDETIPKSTSDTGRLRNILEAGRANSVVWLLDPDLLDLADKASKGYLVKTSKENVNGVYVNEIATWFNELRTSVAAKERWSMTYANADLASMQQNKAKSAFEQSVTIARTTTEQKLGFTTGGTFLFQDKYPVSETVIGLANSLGTNAIVLPDTALPPIVGTTFTPSGTTTIETPNGRVKVFLTDSLLSSASEYKVENAAQTTFQRQRLYSDTLLIALQLPNIERNIFVSPNAYWEPTNEGAAIFASAVTGAPWVKNTEAWNVLAKDVSTVERDNFLTSAAAKNVELSADQMSRIKKGQLLLAQLTGLFEQPGVVSADYATAILRAGSQYWQNAPSQARDFINSINETLTLSRDKVRILAGNSVVLPSDKGPIPITIANDFAEPVIVKISAKGTPTFRFKSDELDPITIPANSKQSLSFTGSVQGTGSVDVTLQLYTRDGVKYGEPKIISVRSAAYSTVATYFTGFAFFALILLSSISIYKRIRLARKNAK
ncbi:MAG: hypothetical protein RIS18_830 [Actinomycetota bacterium]